MSIDSLCLGTGIGRGRSGEVTAEAMCWGVPGSGHGSALAHLEVENSRIECLSLSMCLRILRCWSSIQSWINSGTDSASIWRRRCPMITRCRRSSGPRLTDSSQSSGRITLKYCGTVSRKQCCSRLIFAECAAPSSPKGPQPESLCHACPQGMIF